MKEQMTVLSTVPAHFYMQRECLTVTEATQPPCKVVPQAWALGRTVVNVACLLLPLLPHVAVLPFYLLVAVVPLAFSKRLRFAAFFRHIKQHQALDSCDRNTKWSRYKSPYF